MKKTGPFRFKRFAVEHSRSSMKIGVDGVLLGCWADLLNARKILDVGTGCGVIALICAQRSDCANVTGIDIHRDSVGEASENFAASPFAARLEALEADYMDMPEDKVFDCIVSNPPYFDSGVSEVSSARINARHQLNLSIPGLVAKASRLLTEEGRLSVILPADQYTTLADAAADCGMALTRLARVRGTAKSPVKRIMAELRSGCGCKADLQEEEIIIMEKGTEPTPRYRQLTGDFYLDY